MECKKHGGVSLSTIKAEYVLASAAGREVLGLGGLITELGIKVAEPMEMHMDNQAAISQVKIKRSNSSAKHIDIRFK